VGGLRVEVTDRVVGDRGHVHDGVDSPEVVGPGVTYVPGALLVVRRDGAEVAPVVPARVEP
jgi:hypothetical protein